MSVVGTPSRCDDCLKPIEAHSDVKLMALKSELMDFSFSLNCVVAAKEWYVNPIEFSHDLEACGTIAFIYRHDDDNGHSGLGLCSVAGLVTFSSQAVFHPCP